MSEGERSTLTAEEVNELHAKAVAALDRLLVATPSSELYLEKAGLYWNHPDGTGLSRVALKEGLARFPDDQMLTIYLANSYIIDDRIDAAIGVMDDYLAKRPDDIQTRERLGQMLMDAGKDAAALDVHICVSACHICVKRARYELKKQGMGAACCNLLDIYRSAGC